MGKSSRRKREKQPPILGYQLSDALWKVIEPFNLEGLGAQETGKLLSIAAAAWNVSLLPPDKMKPALNALIDEFCPSTGVTAAANHNTELAHFGALVVGLIQRKLKYFAPDRRAIVKLDIAERANQLEITVTSATKASDAPTGNSVH